MVHHTVLNQLGCDLAHSHRRGSNCPFLAIFSPPPPRARTAVWRRAEEGQGRTRRCGRTCSHAEELAQDARAFAASEIALSKHSRSPPSLRRLEQLAALDTLRFALWGYARQRGQRLEHPTRLLEVVQRWASQHNLAQTLDPDLDPEPDPAEASSPAPRLPLRQVGAAAAGRGGGVPRAAACRAARGAQLGRAQGVAGVRRVCPGRGALPAASALHPHLHPPAPTCTHLHPYTDTCTCTHTCTHVCAPALAAPSAPLAGASRGLRGALSRAAVWSGLRLAPPAARALGGGRRGGGGGAASARLR